MAAKGSQTSHQISRRKKQRNKWIYGRRLRQVVQALALLLFLTLLIVNWSAGQTSSITGSITGLFFRLNPLTAFTAMIAGRTWIPAMGWALVTVAATLLLGRVWCGWICPLGTILDWVRFPKAQQRAASISPNWRSAKYVLLLVILGMALLGNLTLLIFDPITLLTRATVTGLLPAFNYGFTQLEMTLYQWSIFQPAVSWIESALRGVVLPSIQAVYFYSIFVFALLVGVVATNALADRFWCRYLCPLGALLGLLSKVSVFRPLISANCISCGQCSNRCPVGAIQPGERDKDSLPAIVTSECTLCLDCFAACPKNDIAFRWQRPPIVSSGTASPNAVKPDYDPSRRQALISLGAGAAGALMLSTEAAVNSPDPHLIRPPGVGDESEFLSKCIRCGECIQVCATTGLQPSLLEAGLAGLWTPRLAPRLGPCDYSCTACGEVCPSGAIPLLALATKRQKVMGMAVIDRSRCLPWAYGTHCIVCEEMCPIPDKAIRVEEVSVIDEAGEEVVLQRPYVLQELCIGCGICEYNCPMEAQAAVRVQRR